MVISTYPNFLSLDKKVVKAVIMQLELDSNNKDNSAESKENNSFFKKGFDFINHHNFSIVQISTLNNVHRYYSKKRYIATFFPTVPTPPPNFS